MKRVLYFDISGRGGGSNVSLRTLVDALDPLRVEPVLAFGTAPSPAIWGERPAISIAMAGLDNYDFFPAGWNAPWLHHLACWLLRLPRDYAASVRIVRRIRPDVVHVNCGQAIAFGLAARRLRVPTVWHVRELVCRNTLGRMQARLYGACAARVIVPSHAVARRLAGCRSPVLVIPNAAAVAPVSDATAADFRAQHGIRPDALAVLFLGAYQIPKGPLFLAGVADRLTDAPIVFVLAGEPPAAPSGPAHRALRAAYRGLGGGPAPAAQIAARWGEHARAGRAVFTGYVPAATAIGACDLVVCPNLAGESFGRTVVEANALGRAVVASEVEPFDETIEDGVTGWRLPLSEVRWAARLRGLAREPERLAAAGERARNRSARYEPAAHAARLMAVYDEVADGAPKLAR